MLRGAGRGRTLGFPTANLKPDRPLILAPGVYAARAAWDDRRGDAVVNVGYRPTFGEEQYWIETYVFDFDGDLYDRELSVEFLAPHPAEMKFARRRGAQASGGARHGDGRGGCSPRKAADDPAALEAASGLTAAGGG